MAPRTPDFRSRQSALKEAMRAQGLRAVIIFGFSSYSGSGASGQGYLRFLAGWTARFGLSALIVPAEGPVTLLVPSAHDVLYIRKAFPWIDRAFAESPRNYGRLIRKILGETGVDRAGLAGLMDIPQPVYADLAGDEAGPSFTAAEEVVDALRVVKDAADIEHLRQAAAISDRMLEHLRDRSRGFRGPAWKLVAELEFTGRSMGAEIATCWLATGQPADYPGYRLEENEQEIRDGDQILVGTYVTYRGYWAHCLRMGAAGEPSDEYVKLHEIALEQHRAAAAQIQPGKDARLVQIEGIRRAEELLPGSTGYAARFRQAHFIGLDYAEKPTALPFPQPDNWSTFPVPEAREVILQPGMVMELHTNLGQEGAGFGVMGDIYLVTQNGAERLTTFPQELFGA